MWCKYTVGTMEASSQRVDGVVTRQLGVSIIGHFVFCPLSLTRDKWSQSPRQKACFYRKIQTLGFQKSQVINNYHLKWLSENEG